ncbi:hypothetical protein CXB51_000588 [Gossypium anomalum]|uniref:Integrase catalytic domain-containing protein n=1 Tax=Gossypium anomalum TaxID=47600 RepID=A0A8J5ZIM6_9ROSI|nr:hypothetical protein CXB51_000588 [Gossypium anomalum]
MASSSFSPVAPLIFNGEGFHIWLVKMRTYLQAFGLLEVVNSDAEPALLKANPTVAQIMQHAEERTKRHKAMSCIQNCVSDMIFTRIMTYETPKQAWDKLKEEFQGTERTRQQQLLNLRRDFENLKMKKEETIKQYSDRIMAVVNNIRLIGEQFDEVRIVEKVLSTLPERYEAKISSLEDSRDLARISLTELINALYAQEQIRASRIEEHQEGAFQAKVKPNSSNAAYKGKKNWRDKSKIDALRKWDRPCRHCKKPGHPEAKCWFKPDAICQHCKKRGHVERVCKEKDKPAKGKITKGWLLDSGCTNHMSPDASIFKSLDRSCKTRVKIGNGHCIQAEGKGNVMICTPSGNKLIPNVLFVPKIDRNLLSIAQLLEKGYTVVFKGNECQISDQKGSILMTVAMTDKSFVVDWNKGLDSAYAASIEESKLWHQRLGHANFKLMAQMISKDMAENFIKSVLNEGVCEVCQLDVCGPMKTESLNGNRYFILFIDDSTRYYWIYFLKNKSEVVQAFLKFKTAAETETGCKLKSIRSDNGAEYISAQF